ncbi:Taste receptor type 1 member 1 G-protein coupled receptor 70 [Triplophysa tibetana]|uniref:Taste receptor type 1 member 1 G-protein coupled receptor 70 n=1 Tax=Triplophysa tibetana TaxID=1572043 RepID=A0A5A9MVZ3_9TELE|nr:Taste receptor type 1 member 1 G-protein coupled receptor 70 [Triplophysa tibetana]
MLFNHIYNFLLGFTYCVFYNVFCSSSEFSSDGDFLLGGLFPVHEVELTTAMFSPESIECSRHTFSKSGYQMFQVMRLSVEEINNSTTLLPNVSLGYDIFDHCSDSKNFPSVFSFISQNGSIKPKEKLNTRQPKVIALTGPYGSTRTITIAPLATMDLIPMVNYGATSYTLSDKLNYPSFIRTIPSNKDLVQVILRIIKGFGWNWVAFLGGPDNYSEDGLQLFNKYIRNTGICLGYQESLSQNANYSLTLRRIDKLNINVIVLFAEPQYAKNIIKAAIANNIRDKVWIASETLSTNQQILREPGIKIIGTVIGIRERLLSVPGFNEFTRKAKETTKIYMNDNVESKIQTKTCNQDCENCSLLNAEEIIQEDSTLSFAIYTAIYTIAHALHKVLQCNMNECHKNTTVKPYMLLGEIKKLDFLLHGRQVKYDANGDPAVSYAVVLWHTETNPPWIEMVGTYDTYPEITFTINNSLLPWRNNVSVPFSNCSVECEEGFSRAPVGYHDCCFLCKKCPQNTYVNYSREPYTCRLCAESEWSDEGSMTCQQRSVVYLQGTEIASIAVILSGIWLLILLVIMLIVFAQNYNTPVVRSAGGSMSFLMIVCLIIPCIGLLFSFGEPTSVRCRMRSSLYAYFYTVCLSCLTVRSFQIVCVFKMAEFPNVHGLWVKYNGQWVFVTSFSVFYLIACVFWSTISPAKLFRDSSSFKDQILLTCEIAHPIAISIILFISFFLGFLCILFSYVARDLPKNYNEAKSITFSIILYYMVWIVYYIAYVYFKSKYVMLFNALVQVLSIYAILFSYFVPKCYIMLFQSKKNTAAYFQTSIQNYTQTLSRS